MRSMGFTPNSAAAATSAGLPNGMIVPAIIVATNMPAKPYDAKKVSMLAKKGAAAMLNVFSSQIAIMHAAVSMSASFMDERIHDVLSRSLRLVFVCWFCSAIRVHWSGVKDCAVFL